jgi:hypothetical protein
MACRASSSAATNSAAIPKGKSEVKTKIPCQKQGIFVFFQYLHLFYAVAYNECMGVQETGSRSRTRKNQLQGIILDTISVVGILGLAVVAPNVVGAMSKLGMLPSSRQREVIKRSCDRMVRNGLLRWEKNKLRLTAKGASTLRAYKIKNFETPRPRKWDGKWRVLIFDIPEYRGALRNKIRATLQLIGFMRLQNSVWVYPYDCEDLIALLKADFRVGKDLLYMIVDSIEQDKELRREFYLKN